MSTYFEEEGHYFFTMSDFKELVLLYGPRVFDDFEKHCPEVYEAMKSHLANKEIEVFLSSNKRDEDYYND